MLFYRVTVQNGQSVWQIGVLNGLLLTQLQSRLQLVKLLHATSYTPDAQDPERGTFCFNTLYLYRTLSDYEADKAHPLSKFIRLGGAATSLGSGPAIAFSDRKQCHNGRFDSFETPDGQKIATLSEVLAYKDRCQRSLFERGVLHYYHWKLQRDPNGGYQLRQSSGKIHPWDLAEAVPPD